MLFDGLNDDNFMMFVMKHYKNPQCKSIEEFYEDLNRIKYIKRLLGKYVKKGIIKTRLVLNHIIILNNVFGNSACTRILFYKLEPEFHPSLKTFLEFLKYLPTKIPEAKLEEIPKDHKILKELEKIK
tara:strand:+ start:3512 stop:3892 length:381 start_codon:yes stop_codon:yes gene_type:complete